MSRFEANARALQAQLPRAMASDNSKAEYISSMLSYFE